MNADFAETYRKMTNDELLSTVAREDELQREAANALSAELERRNLALERRTYLNKFWGTERVITFPKGVPGPYDDKIRALADLARPRPIRMTFHAKFSALMVFGWPLLLLALIGKDEYRHPTPGIGITRLLIFVGALEILLGSFMWLRPYVKHRRLVSGGDLAIGRVTEMLLAWGKGVSCVRYEFETYSGERFTRMRPTYRLLSPGIRVPVFYDSQKPKRQVALCVAFCEVIVPEQGLRKG